MSLHELVRSSARRVPGRPAVVGPGGSLSYAELDLAADRAAARLRELGVSRGDRVVIWSAKSPVMVAVMQAVLRAGAAYVPVDGTNPARRVLTIAGDCKAAVICTTADKAASLREPGGVPVIEMAGAALAGEPDGHADESAAPEDLAYILYTSGSTGTPKGVCISHGAARAFVDWSVSLLGADEGDRFGNHAPFSFDVSVLDLYAAFSVGAAVHLVPAELAYAPSQLTEFIYQRELSVWYSVPSAITLMMRDGGLLTRPAPPGLRAVLFAGEVFPISGLRQLAAWTDAKLFNLYGPTETNVCTFREVTGPDLERDRPVPIGAASCGDTAWAETAGGRRAGPGEEGELVISGPTVMLGYWGKPPREGPYRTGDIVRVLDDGSFDYIGRRDHMVKLRGHRVELGEVEAALAAHPQVGETAALVTGTGADARLHAFVLPRAGERPGVLELRRHSAERLPRYMIPDELHFLTEFPRTGNGKVDRARLASGEKS